MTPVLSVLLGKRVLLVLRVKLALKVTPVLSVLLAKLVLSVLSVLLVLPV